MKKLFWVLIAIVALSAVGVYAADFAPTPNSVVLCDFNSIPDGTVLDSRKVVDCPVIPDQTSLFYYDDFSAGKTSRVIATLVDGIEGKAMKLDWTLDGWAGFGVSSIAGKTGPMWDWSKAKSITFYAKSADGKRASFAIGLADANDERFRVAMKTEVNGTDWVKFVLPMDKFKARADWQPNTAKKNTVIDSPGTNFEFCPLSSKGSVILDYIEINN